VRDTDALSDLLDAIRAVREGREPAIDPDDAYERAIAEARGEDEVDPFTFSASPRDEVNASVRGLREDAGLTQEQFTEVMRSAGFDWKRSTVTEIDRMGRRVSYEELWGIAAVFGVPVASLLLPSEVSLELNPLMTVDGRRARELLVGKGGSIGTGGPTWLAASHAVPDGVDRPARDLWRNRRMEEGN
jgi:transcriptional regulator with XRE-family HTH domain